MNDFQIYLNEMEKQGAHLKNKSKKIITAQCWYAPKGHEQIDQIFKHGFVGIYSVAFYRDPVRCIKNESPKCGLMQCRVSLVDFNESNGRITCGNNQAALPAFL